MFVEKELREEVRELRGEIDLYLDELNQSSSEVAQVYEYLDEVDAKIDKLTERIDALQALVLASTPSQPKLRLTRKERELLDFMQGVGGPMTSEMAAAQLGVTGDAAAQLFYSVKRKGAAVVASTVAGQTFYALSQNAGIFANVDEKK